MKKSAWKIGAHYGLVGVLIAVLAALSDTLVGEAWWLRLAFYAAVAAVVIAALHFVPRLKLNNGKPRLHDWVGIFAVVCLCVFVQEALSGAFAAVELLDGIMASLLWVVAPLTALVICARMSAESRGRTARRIVGPEPKIL